MIDIYSPTEQDSISPVELAFYHEIMAYRASLGLAPIPLSTNLSATAGRHALDTVENIWRAGLVLPDGANLHSWSDAFYYGDHRAPEVMWNAPTRLGLNYPSEGYEISAAGYGDVQAALAGWQGSPGHNAVITNTGIWQRYDWQAIGIGVEQANDPALMFSGRAYHVWFGALADAGGPPVIQGTAAGEALAGTDFADIVMAGMGADTVDGGTGNDLLNGGAGGDVLAGGQDNDTLQGGTGDDIVTGGAGNDVMSGDSGNDTLYGNAGSDTLYGADGQDLLLGGDQADTLHGNQGNDLLNGGAGGDFLAGGQDNDTLQGGTGDDVVTGGAGNDVMSGDSGNDTLYGNAGSDTLYGADGQDLLLGGDQADTLHGNQGDDTLIGGAGGDLLAGGIGADRFVFASASESSASGGAWDVIADFEQGVDRIDLSGVDALTTVAGNQDFTFIGTQAHTGAGATLRFVTATQNTYVYGDTNGDGAGDFVIVLQGRFALAADDFIL